MLKPEKKWVVGDRQFDSYDEARSFAAKQRPELLRRDLIDFLNNSVNWEGYTGSIEAIVDPLLSAFTIKRKSPK